jgi:DNA-binding MurR/RpiR family transcriptional regulator
LKRIENWEEYEDYIHNFFKEKIGTITNLSTYLRPKEKHRANDIIQQAKKIDIEKIKRLSTVA